MAKPFFSGNYGSSLARIDTRPIIEAGKAQGQMFASIGKDFGGAIEKYQENKKKGEAADIQIGAILENMSPERQQEIISGESKFGKSLEKFIEGELPNSKKEALLGSLITTNAADKAKIQEDRESKAYQDKQNIQNAALRFAEYNIGSETAAVPALRNITDPQKFSEVATTISNIEKNPFLTQLLSQELDKRVLRQQELRLKGPILTPGEEAMDKKFAEDMLEFNEADVRKGLTQLNEASTRLAKEEDLTGAIVGLMPKAFKDIANPDASEVQEAVEEVVQRNLRLVLGAQFTAQEGERLISRAFNPRLDQKENKKRVDRLIKSINDAMQLKLEQRNYFQRNGTLKGFRNPAIPSISMIETQAFDSATTEVTQEMVDDLKKQVEARKQAINQVDAFDPFAGAQSNPVPTDPNILPGRPIQVSGVRNQNTMN